jgi:hypothetical protein
MKKLNQKHMADQEQHVIDMAMDYSERVRSYGNRANLVNVEDYLKRLPKEWHPRFLELVNLDELASSLESTTARSSQPTRHEHAARAARPT